MLITGLGHGKNMPELFTESAAGNSSEEKMTLGNMQMPGMMQASEGMQLPGEGKQGAHQSGVSLNISQEGLKQMYEEQARAAAQSDDGMEDFAKIMEIARRISRGDRVPLSDEKKLMEYDGDLYQMAKAAALVNRDKDSKDHKALFEEEGDINEKLRALEEGEDVDLRSGGEFFTMEAESEITVQE